MKNKGIFGILMSSAREIRDVPVGKCFFLKSPPPQTPCPPSPCKHKTELGKGGKDLGPWTEVYQLPAFSCPALCIDLDKEPWSHTRSGMCWWQTLERQTPGHSRVQAYTGTGGLGIVEA